MTPRPDPFFVLEAGRTVPEANTGAAIALVVRKELSNTPG
jgi:hypothetical protein